ncbi:AEC family transporter [Mesorhizobium sp. CAU 1741]|uniref:AEC family transporter n=1 Tax=Mesorhizobium sp. CAU 1741 TaxID=3140366 RepID=UPI00325B3946
MLDIFESILPIFLLIGSGAVMRRLPIISDAAWPGMEQLSYWFLYPCLLFATIYKADFSSIELDAMLASLIVAMLAMAGLVLALWPPLKRSGLVAASEYSSVFQTSVRWNAFIALPLATKIFPPEGAAVVALAMAAIIVPINVVVIFVVTRFANGRSGILDTLKRVALNPLVLAVLLGMAFRQMPFGLYQPLDDTLSLLGSAALGLGLMAIGAGLRLSDLVTTRLAVWLPVVLKLVLFPVLLVGIAFAFGIRGDALTYLALCGAVPTAMNGYVLARQLGGDAELYAAVATLQTALSFFTVPLALSLAAQFSSG